MKKNANYAVGNNNLSTVVRTQKSLCKTIPKKNKHNNITKKLNLGLNK